MATTDIAWIGDGLNVQHSVFGGGAAFEALNDLSTSNGITSNTGTKYSEFTPGDSPDDAIIVSQISLVMNVTKPSSVTAAWQYSLNLGGSWSSELAISTTGAVTINWIKLNWTKAQFDGAIFRVRSTVASSDPFYLFSAYLRITYTVPSKRKIMIIGEI